MTTTKIDFSKNVKVSAEIQDLISLGWVIEGDNLEDYHVDITVNNEGKTFWNLTNTQKQAQGIWEGSDKEVTGDDEQTLMDLEKLYTEGKLFDIQENY